MGRAAEREQHLVGIQRAPVGERDQPGVAHGFDRLDRRAGDDLDAVDRHLRLKPLAQVVVEAAQDALAAIDQRDLRAQALQQARELHRDVAAALDHRIERQPRPFEEGI